MTRREFLGTSAVAV
ncbi:MAG: twin-arginine translocation signal domain-containing protein, partial [Verrucomicrobia bacterium]|nr:twin-arginine translocation signal domain-containing protein [Verrucomicrobiota bacterium]